MRSIYAEEIDALKRRGAKRRVRRRLAAGTLACLIAAAGTITAVGWRNLEAPPGKPSIHAYWDGSRIYLDAGAVLEVPIAPWRREARLVEGDAVFDIDHDPDRPFTVRSAASTLTDLGTRFLVRFRGGETEVAVFDGKVEIGSPTGHRMTLPAGQAAKAGPLGLSNTPMPEEDAATAWRQGRLIFRNATLEQVAVSLSKYNPVPVVLNGPGLARLKISGSFRLDDIDGALRTLETALPVRVNFPDDRQIIEISPSRP